MNLPSRSSIESAELLRRIEAGDNEATSLVFERYLERLTRLAQSRLAARIATRVDPEDIVMSAYRSFFVAARTGRFELNRGGDLWRLLAEMTLHKLYRQVERHQTKRRSVESERPLVDIDHVAAPNSGNEPTHEEVVATADELEAVFRQLPENGRHALELRLQGYEHGEIAERLKCSERTVGRLLTEARRVMVSRAGSNFIPSAARAVATARQAMPSSAVPFDLSNIGHREDWSDFVLQAQIGIGAMGKVYRAFQKSRQREVAVKFLKKHLTRESSNIQRFLRELQRWWRV